MRISAARILPVLLILLTVVPARGQAFDGPLQVRNQLPLFLGMHPPYLESAAVQDSLALSLHHSSTYMTEISPRWVVNMDLELTELDIRLKKKLGQRSEIGLEVPVIRPSGGFFDGPLEAWHDLLPVGDYGRHERPENAFLYQIVHDGRPVIVGVNDRTGFGDVRLTYKQVVSASSVTVSAMISLELPTGDAPTGYGNGSYDTSFALLADGKWGGSYYGYGNIGYIFPGDLKGHQTIPLRNSWYAGGGIEAAWWERFSVLVQALVQQSPLPETGIDHVDRPGILLTVGGRYHFPNSSIEFSLTEDPNVSGAPDFIADMAWMLRY
jgi:hypothetical protein